VERINTQRSDTRHLTDILHRTVVNESYPSSKYRLLDIDVSWCQLWIDILAFLSPHWFTDWNWHHRTEAGVLKANLKVKLDDEVGCVLLAKRLSASVSCCHWNQSSSPAVEGCAWQTDRTGQRQPLSLIRVLSSL